MATNKAIRADDVSGLNIATVSFTEDAVTKHAQQVSVVDATTPTQKLAIDSSGRPTVNVNGTVVTTTTALIKDSGAVELFTASNPGRVDVTGATVQPVSGTFWQATQPVSGTFFQAKQPVSAASGDFADGANVTLGAKTDAKSTATDATSITAMQVLKQISASVQAPPSQAVTNAGVFAVQSTGQANSGVDIGDVTINNAAGASAVNVQDGGNSLTVDGTVANSNLPTTVDTNSGLKSASTLRVVLATDQPALTNKLLVTPDSVALPANQSVNVSQINAVTPLMGAGNTGTGSLRVTIATDQAQLTNALKVDGSAVTQPVSIAATVNTASVPATSGGCTIFSAANSGTKAQIKGTAGQIYGWQILNTTAAIAYVQIWNVASASVTVGTTAPDLVLGLPASGGATFSSDVGIAFSTAITVASTTTRAGSTGAATEIAILYK